MIITKNKDGTATYTITLRKGQLGDFEAEWWTDEDYEKHERYIEEIKADGTFGEEFEVSLTLKNCPLFDEPIHNPKRSKLPLESYRMIFLDLSK